MKKKAGLFVAQISIVALWLVTAISIQASAKAPGPSDIQQMQQARMLFNNGQLDAAYKEYDKIKRDSDFWLESLEEKAQIKGRQGQYDEVLALLKTPTDNVFVGVAGPEPFFTLALTHLKICDYSSVFKDTKQFKSNFSDRLADLENINKFNEQGQAVINQVISKVDGMINESSKDIGPKSNAQSQLTVFSLGTLVKQLPRNIHRDKKFQDLVLIKKTNKRDSSIKKHIRALAKKEIQEIESVVNRLHIVEAEATQRLLVLEKGQKSGDKLSHIKGERYDMKFPVTDEVWVDELGHFAASVEMCPDLKRRAGI